MTDDLSLRRKWTLRAHGQRVIFVKKSNESAVHVFMKAFIWALYLPQYPNLVVEIRVGDRYKPDVVSRGTADRIFFWGEAGQIGRDKIRSLARRYRDTHFALAKWDTSLEPYVEIVTEAVEGLDRHAPFDLFSFAPDSAERFIDGKGQIILSFDDLADFRRVGPEPPNPSSGEFLP